MKQAVLHELLTHADRKIVQESVAHLQKNFAFCLIYTLVIN